jgi:hypothetical protein
MFGLNLLSVIPLRSEPRESSEQISQLIFGIFYALQTVGKGV